MEKWKSERPGEAPLNPAGSPAHHPEQEGTPGPLSGPGGPASPVLCLLWELHPSLSEDAWASRQGNPRSYGIPYNTLNMLQI